MSPSSVELEKPVSSAPDSVTVVVTVTVIVLPLLPESEPEPEPEEPELESELPEVESEVLEPVVSEEPESPEVVCGMHSPSPSLPPWELEIPCVAEA